MKRVVYKITTSNNKTRPDYYNETQWGEGIEHTAHGNGEMCSDAFIHAYATPLMAVFMNPAHTGYSNPNLWRCIAVVKANDGTKLGCTSLRTIKQIELPKVTLEMRVAFGIYCALSVYKEPSFVKWARAWLAEKDRSTTAAYNAAANAAATASAAASAAAYAGATAAYATNAAANAAYAAANAAYATNAASILRASRKALKY